MAQTPSLWSASLVDSGQNVHSATQLKTFFRELRDGSVRKVPAPQKPDRTPSTLVKAGDMASVCGHSTVMGVVGRIPGAHRLGSLAASMNSRFSKKHCLKKISWRETKEGTGYKSLASTQKHVGVVTHTDLYEKIPIHAH